ncbi:MAG TPA: hypothetical protein VFA18_24365 [Gemmataceae bacterium]|nr:hypothetical protein [Gemmataceae bacterium]
MFTKPGIGLGFRHDGRDLHGLLGYIVEHADIVADPQAVLGMGEAAQPLDPAPARFRRLLPEVLFEGIPHGGASIRPEAVQVRERFWGQHDFVAHSSLIPARSVGVVKPAVNEGTCPDLGSGRACHTQPPLGTSTIAFAFGESNPG